MKLLISIAVNLYRGATQCAMASYRLFIPLCLIISFSACLQQTQNSKLTKQLHVLDSAYAVTGSYDNAMAIIKVNPQIDPADPLKCSYYYIMAYRDIRNNKQMNMYADSGLAWFKDASRISAYPSKYFEMLLTKGDACFLANKYSLALNYYNDAKGIVPLDNSNRADLAAKMAGLYYGQKNFKLAAKYWAESYHFLNASGGKFSPQKLFGLKQAALNNSGISFQNAGDLDSAAFYYFIDKTMIDQAERTHLVGTYDINNTRAAVYDNIGGLSLQQGKLQQAATYLSQYLAIPNPNTDARAVPPLLKLAELNTLTGNLTAAADAFKQSKALLTSFPGQSTENEIKWYRLYAQYLFKIKQPAAAYAYLNLYVAHRDSVDRKLTALYQLDVERELLSINQQQKLAELTQADRFKKMSLVTIAVFVLLSLVIIILITRSLKQTRKNNNIANRQNEQLKYTLAELETVNKNYIRVMRVMAHDLRNPLSGMTGLATSLLTENEFDEENKYMLKLIETTGMHSMEMINELLKSGLGNENEPIVKQLIDLRSLLADSVELLQFKAKEKQQHIIFKADEGPFWANVNYDNLWRVFNNLIVNAIKFSYNGGQIMAAIKREDGSIIISVTDNGVGINNQEKDLVFDMFTTAKKPGTGGEQPFGLGLSISKKIVEKHQGKIWFESAPGLGTTFYIKLPAAK